MKYNTTGYIVLILLSFSILYSCAPGSCQQDTVATVKAGFYQTGTGKELTADSVTMYGLGMDSSKIYNKALNVKSVNFPLTAKSDTSRFILKINGKIDTVTMIYTSYPYLVSKECGYTFYHLLDTVYDTRPDLDFLKMNKNITTINEENIRIFY